MGKLFREIIVFNMNKPDAGREDDDTSDIDACCSGQDAQPRARCWLAPLQRCMRSCARWA